MAKDNRSVGRFVLDGIPPMRRGEPQIEVTFDIDANGVLSVSARETKTGKQQSIRIEASTGLSKEEVERMKAEAQANADEDQKARETVEKINEADSLIFQTERQLGEYGDKIPAESKEKIEKAITELKAAHQAQNLEAITAGIEAVNNAWYEATAQMNPEGGNPGAGFSGNPQDGTPPPNDGDNNSDTDNVTDVEYEEVDNK